MSRTVKESHDVQIICPSCISPQSSKEVWFESDPFPTYVHTCTECDYVITESEWDEVK